jgi:hypothetical protein
MADVGPKQTFFPFLSASEEEAEANSILQPRQGGFLVS